MRQVPGFYDDRGSDGAIEWNVNLVARSLPATDDPSGFFERLTVDNGYSESLDEHARFLAGDWPR